MPILANTKSPTATPVDKTGAALRKLGCAVSPLNRYAYGTAAVLGLSLAYMPGRGFRIFEGAALLAYDSPGFLASPTNTHSLIVWLQGYKAGRSRAA